MASYHTVSVDDLLAHAEVVASVDHILVVFLETSFVEQQFQSLSGCQLVLIVLLINSLLTTSEQGVIRDSLPALHEC